MFGYIVVNKPEMKFREFAVYQSYYCGLCQSLKKKYGRTGQLTLSYDMTFLVLLLTGLYEPETAAGTVRCIAHPLEKHPVSRNKFSDYAADVNLLLSYYKCMDDWQDERKLGKYLFAAMLRNKNNRIAKEYPEKTERICENLEKIRQCEKSGGSSIDEIAGYFGRVMAELFVYKEDEWAQSLRKIGFYFGKFIYLMDAYDDIETDLRKGNYNPFAQMYQNRNFDEEAGQILTMMMAECSREFEALPILMNVEILRNILYSGVWCRYDLIRQKRLGNQAAGQDGDRIKQEKQNGENADFAGERDDGRSI